VRVGSRGGEGTKTFLLRRVESIRKRKGEGEMLAASKSKADVGGPRPSTWASLTVESRKERQKKKGPRGGHTQERNPRPSSPLRSPRRGEAKVGISPNKWRFDDQPLIIRKKDNYHTG